MSGEKTLPKIILSEERAGYDALCIVPGHFKEEWVKSQKCREALSVSSYTFNNILLFWFTICKYRMFGINVRLFKCVLHNQLHFMLSKSWILILQKDPPLILVMVWFIMSYLCVLWIEGHSRSFLQKQWMNMINVAWLEWTPLHFSHSTILRLEFSLEGKLREAGKKYTVKDTVTNFWAK